MAVELESIFWARLRALKQNHGERISTLEDHSTALSQRSDSRWQEIKHWAELAPKIVGLLRVLYHTWPLLIAAAAAVWTLVLPGLRYLLRLLYSGLGYLAGLPTG